MVEIPDDALVAMSDILENQPTDVPVMNVYGELAAGVRMVSATSMALVLTMGRIPETGETVLLPYCETKIEGWSPPEDDGEPRAIDILGEILTLENAAYLLVNLASDVASTCDQLSKLDGASIRIEPRRLEQTRYLLAHAAREALRGVAKLTPMIPMASDADVPRPAARTRGRRIQAKGKPAEPVQA